MSSPVGATIWKSARFSACFWVKGMSCLRHSGINAQSYPALCAGLDYSVRCADWHRWQNTETLRIVPRRGGAQTFSGERGHRRSTRHRLGSTSMSHTYSHNLVHCVFSTKERLSLIDKPGGPLALRRSPGSCEEHPRSGGWRDGKSPPLADLVTTDDDVGQSHAGVEG